MKIVIVYTLIALLFYIIGFFTLDWYWFVGAIVISVCVFYWIKKEWKKK